MNFQTTHEEFCFNNAAYFTTHRRITRATRATERHATFEAAKAHGATFGDGRTMVYAVTANELSAHIINA